MELKGVEEEEVEGEKRWWFGQKRRQICIRLLENCLHLHTFEIRLKDGCCDG